MENSLSKLIVEKSLLVTFRHRKGGGGGRSYEGWMGGGGQKL